MNTRAHRQLTAILCHAKHGLTRVLHCSWVCVGERERERERAGVHVYSLFACLCPWWTVMFPWWQNTYSGQLGVSLFVDQR